MDHFDHLEHLDFMGHLDHMYHLNQIDRPFPTICKKKVVVYLVYLFTIQCTILDGSWVIYLAQVKCLSDCWILVEVNFAFVCDSMFETWLHLNFAKSDFDFDTINNTPQTLTCMS